MSQSLENGVTDGWRYGQRNRAEFIGALSKNSFTLGFVRTIIYIEF